MLSLTILWTSDDKFTVESLLGMYTINSMKNNWWDNLVVIIWGSSNKLIQEDKDIQNLIKEMKKNNVIIEACKACSDKIGTTTLLTNLGVDVKYMGAPMTSYLKADSKFFTV